MFNAFFQKPLIRSFIHSLIIHTLTQILPDFRAPRVKVLNLTCWPDVGEREGEGKGEGRVACGSPLCTRCGIMKRIVKVVEIVEITVKRKCRDWSKERGMCGLLKEVLLGVEVLLASTMEETSPPRKILCCNSWRHKVRSIPQSCFLQRFHGRWGEGDFTQK